MKEQRDEHGFIVLQPIHGGPVDQFIAARGTMRKLPKNSNTFLYNLVDTYGVDEVLNMTEVGLGDYVYNKGIIHALNMNVGRNIPWIEDGLKSGERRALFIMNRSHLYNGKFDKVAGIIGDMIKHVYPHGDQAPADTIYRLGRERSTMIPYIVPYGNFGNMDDMRPAASRYAAASLSDYAVDCFFSEPGTRHPIYDVKDNYKYSDKEPVFLTSRYPNILMQWSLGIGKGAASWLGAFNSTDIFKIAIAMLDDQKIPVDIYPDAPIPIDIINKHELKGCFDKSAFKVHMRAPYEVVLDKRRGQSGKIEDKYTVVFAALPLNITGDMVKNEIIAIKEKDQKKSAKKLPEVLNVETEVDKISPGGIRFIVEYEHGYDPNTLAEKLYKSTSLGKTIGVKYKLITDNQPGSFTPREIMIRWITQRYDQKRRYYHQKALQCAKDRARLEAICIVLDKGNIDKAIALIKKAKTEEDSVTSLCKEFGFTEFQARMVLLIKLSNLTRMNIDDTIKKRDEAISSYKYYRKLLTSEEAIKEKIKEELQEGLEKYGRKRMARVINLKGAILEDADKAKLIVYNKEFYYCLNSAEDLPSIASKIDYTFRMAKIQNQDSVVVFSTDGHCKVLDGYTFKVNTQGISMSTLAFDSVVSILAVNKKASSEIVLVTEACYGKIINLEECLKLSTKGRVINLNEKDSLIAVRYVDTKYEDNLVGLIANDHLYYVKISDIPKLKKSAAGNRLLKGKKAESIHVTNAEFFNMENTKYLLIYGESGYVKMLNTSYLTYTKKVDTITLQGKNVFGVVPLNEGSGKLTFYDNTGYTKVSYEIGDSINFIIGEKRNKFKPSTTIGSPVKIFRKLKNEFYYMK